MSLYVSKFTEYCPIFTVNTVRYQPLSIRILFFLDIIMIHGALFQIRHTVYGRCCKKRATLIRVYFLPRYVLEMNCTMSLSMTFNISHDCRPNILFDSYVVVINFNRVFALTNLFQFSYFHPPNYPGMPQDLENFLPKFPRKQNLRQFWEIWWEKYGNYGT